MWSFRTSRHNYGYECSIPDFDNSRFVVNWRIGVLKPRFKGLLECVEVDVVRALNCAVVFHTDAKKSWRTIDGA